MVFRKNVLLIHGLGRTGSISLASQNAKFLLIHISFHLHALVFCTIWTFVNLSCFFSWELVVGGEGVHTKASFVQNLYITCVYNYISV